MGDMIEGNIRFGDYFENLMARVTIVKSDSRGAFGKPPACPGKAWAFFVTWVTAIQASERQL